MTATQKAYVQLHIAILLFSFTAVLGKLITLSEAPLVWWRLLFTCVSLLVFRQVRQSFKNTPRKLLRQMAANGVLVMLHWVAFYGAVKYSNVSVTLGIMGTVTLFTALLEPLLQNKKIRLLEIILALLTLPGLWLIFRFTGSYTTGIVLALLAALLAALFMIINKKFSSVAHPLVITFVELGFGGVVLTLLMPFYWLAFPEAVYLPAGPADWLGLIIFAVVCTALPYSLSMKALNRLSAFTTNLSFNLEPVYGILLGTFLLGEGRDLSWEFYAGCLIILSAVILYPVLTYLSYRKSKTKLTPIA